MYIRESRNADQGAIEDVILDAFGENEGPNLVRLIRELMIDPAAEPVLSLIALADGQVTGHILFTGACLRGADRELPCAILAPMAVRTARQRQGIGSGLVEQGLDRLKVAGTVLVFVLGDPRFYSRFGFVPAGALGFTTPQPIPDHYRAAWQACERQEGRSGEAAGEVRVADALSDPALWWD